ncbi:MAG TPA: hypothetical protein VFV17_00050 [Usitatibacteraceae bacterium]|nr:hypothetical protein [Usitatibacteraceae bacterium]
MSHAANVSITNSNGSNVVSVDISQLKPNGARKIVWTVTTSGWEFATNGIVIDDNNYNQFSNSSLYANNQKFSWDDANTDTRLYKYTVNVQPVGQPTLGASLDPQIQNGNNPPE